MSTNGNILNLGLSNNNTGGRIEFFGQGLRRMTMNADGRFGIGDIIPTQQLDVDGQIRVRDDLNADQFINLSDKGIKFDNGQEVNELLPMFYAIYIGGAGFGPIPGEVRLFAIVQFDRIPAGWIKCDGSLLNISEHTFLFSLLGSEYGGDGRNTFAVPDLRKALPIQKI